MIEDAVVISLILFFVLLIILLVILLYMFSKKYLLKDVEDKISGIEKKIEGIKGVKDATQVQNKLNELFEKLGMQSSELECIKKNIETNYYSKGDAKVIEDILNTTNELKKNILDELKALESQNDVQKLENSVDQLQSSIEEYNKSLEALKAKIENEYYSKVDAELIQGILERSNKLKEDILIELEQMRGEVR